MTSCTQVIDLSQPTRSARVRGFQPPWRTVYVYVCPACGHQHRLRASSFRGRHPESGRGGIRCGAKTDTMMPRTERART